MKKIGLLCLLYFGVIISPTTYTVHAQTVQILGNSTINGALNGVVLGGAGMLIADKKVNAPFTKNMEDLYALQIGLGVGTLYGLGLGIYDVASTNGSQLLVSGFFNDATNTSAILLMDTFYGAAVGTVVSASITLLSDDPSFQQVKSGLGIGAFAGFGFGIVDGFLIADRSSAPVAYATQPSGSAAGIATIQVNSATSVGLLNPTITTMLEITSEGISQTFTPSVDVVNLRLNF